MASKSVFESDDHSVNSRTSSMWASSNNYADSYNRVAQMLREALLRQGGDSRNHRQIVRNIFRRIDENGSGVLTDQEMKDFVKSPELNIFGNDSSHVEKFTELLVQQIDVNRDGTVSLQELEEFLFPTKTSEDANEIGIVLDICRKAMIRIIGSTGAASAGNDEALLVEFVRIGKSQIKRGGQIEVRLARKSLANLVIPELGRNLLESEIDGVIHSMDANQDGLISAKDFKSWLFPQNNNDNREFLVRYLTTVIEERYHGNVRHMYNAFKTYGLDRISREDFITRMKALDSGLPRNMLNELADFLCSKDKMITFGNMVDFLDIKNFPEPLPEGEFEDEEDDDIGDEEVYTIVPPERRDISFQENTDDSNPQNVIMNVINEIIKKIEIDNGEISSSTNPSDRRELLLLMHNNANHHGNSQNHVVDNDGFINSDDSGAKGPSFQSPPHLLRRVQRSRSGSPRSAGSRDVSDSEPHLTPTHSAMMMFTNQASGGKFSPRSLQSVGSLSPRSSSQYHMTSQSFIDISPEHTLLKRPSSSSLRSLNGQTGGSMYMNMMENLQHLPNSSPAGIKRTNSVGNASNTKMLDSSQPQESMNLTGRFIQGDLASINATSMQSPVTSDEIEEARRLLQETRHQRKDVSPLAKMRQQQQQHTHSQQENEVHHSNEFQGSDTIESLPPPPPPDFSPPPFPASSHHKNNKSHRNDSLKHGALGYSAQQLVEFGYLKHTGRWRGFPYDSWSCCNTSEVVCPLAPKLSNMSPQKTKETLFIHTEKLTPTKTKQDQMRTLSHSIYVEDDNDADVGLSRYSSQAEKRKLTVTVRDSQESIGSSTTKMNNASHYKLLRESQKTPQPRQAAPVLTKFTMDPSQIIPVSFQKSTTKRSSSHTNTNPSKIFSHSTSSPTAKTTEKHTEDPSFIVKSMNPTNRSAHALGKPTIQNETPRTQHIHHHERVIERVIVQPAPSAPPSQPLSATIIANRVEESVKRSTDKVLTSYERALKELRKELEISRNQTNNRDEKVYLAVERQHLAIEELKKHVQQNMLVMRRSIVETLEKQQKEQQKFMQEQARVQKNLERKLATENKQTNIPRSHSAPPAPIETPNKKEKIQNTVSDIKESESAKFADMVSSNDMDSNEDTLKHEQQEKSLPTISATTHPHVATEPKDHESNKNVDSHMNDSPNYDEVFDGDLTAFRHLVREVTDLKDSPMKYIVGDHPIATSPSLNPSTAGLNTTGLSEEALDTLFETGDNFRRQVNKSSRSSFVPPAAATRSVSPNYRYVSPQIKAKANSIVKQEPRIKHKPWIPSANHSNNLFNRIAVVNYSQGHTASSSNNSKKNNMASHDDHFPFTHEQRTHLTHRNPESYPADERRRHDWEHGHNLYHPHLATLHHHPDHVLSNKQRRSPSPARTIHATRKMSQQNQKARNVEQATTPNCLDTLLALHTGDRGTKKISNMEQQKQQHQWPDISQVKMHDAYFEDEIADNSYNSSYSPHRSYPPTSKYYLPASEKISHNEAWKYPPKATASPEKKGDDSKFIDYRLSEEDEHYLKYNHCGQNGKKKKKHRDQLQSIPMSAILESKDEWWAKIMEEKKRREEEAFQRALH